MFSGTFAAEDFNVGMPSALNSDSPDPPTGQRSSSGRQTTIAIALVSAATLLAYSNSFAGVFVFDDINYVLENPLVRYPRRILFPEPGDVWNRPVAYLTFAANYAFGGFDLRGYHAVNLAIHLAAGMALYLLICRTLSSGALANRWAPYAHGVALATTLLWLVHPLQTQAVTYIYQRQESLTSLLYLVSILGFACGVDARTPLRRRGWWTVSVACCGLGMATKEVMVTAPVMVLWYDRVFVAMNWRELLRRRWGIHLALASTWGVLAWMMASAAHLYARFGVLAGSISTWEYARSQPGVILHYLRLCFWPRGQCFDYAWPVADSWGGITVSSTIIMLILLAIAWAAIRNPPLGFLGGWSFLILAPTSSIAPILDLAVEHRLYLPLAAVALGTSLGAVVILEHLVRSAALRYRIQIGVLVGATLALGFTTHCRNGVYHSTVTLWQDVLSKSPRNARAHQNLAVAYLRSGDFAGALSASREALELSPESADSHFNLAEALMQLNRTHEALSELNTSLQLDPESWKGYYRRAEILVKRGELGPAAADFDRAAELCPDPAGATDCRLQCARCRLRLPDQAVEAL